MAVRDIVLSTDEFIRKKSRPVEKFDENLHDLLDDMRETLLDADGADSTIQNLVVRVVR